MKVAANVRTGHLCRPFGTLDFSNLTRHSRAGLQIVASLRDFENDGPRLIESLASSAASGVLPLPLASLRSFAVGQDDSGGKALRG